MLNKVFEILKIISLSKLTRIIIFSLFIMFLTLGLFESLLLSPEDYIQSDAVRIMYVHVPAAWISLGIFSFIAFLSLGIFIFKNKNFVIIAKSFAPSGLVFNLIALVTGSFGASLRGEHGGLGILELLQCWCYFYFISFISHHGDYLKMIKLQKFLV